MCACSRWSPPNLTDRVGDIEMLIAFAKVQPTMLVSVAWFDVYCVCKFKFLCV
jgi:hypothetical protein